MDFKVDKSSKIYEEFKVEIASKQNRLDSRKSDDFFWNNPAISKISNSRTCEIDEA